MPKSSEILGSKTSKAKILGVEKGRFHKNLKKRGIVIVQNKEHKENKILEAHKDRW